LIFNIFFTPTSLKPRVLPAPAVALLLVAQHQREEGGPMHMNAIGLSGTTSEDRHRISLEHFPDYTASPGATTTYD